MVMDESPLCFQNSRETIPKPRVMCCVQVRRACSVIY